MDNGAFSSNDTEIIKNNYETLPSIFEPYGFKLQQIFSNCPAVDPAAAGGAEETTRLLGMQWDRYHDKLSNPTISLNPKADTKRKILSSLAAAYDLFNIYLPLKNEANIFMQDLQAQPKLKWDEKLPENIIKQWERITTKFNKIEPVFLDRCVGDADARYRLITCVDASKMAIGAVTYLQEIYAEKPYFIYAKNKLLNEKLKQKTIPTLELYSIIFGLQITLDIKNQLNSPDTPLPVRISEIYILSDSLVALNWVYSFNIKLENLKSKHSVFVKNKLAQLGDILKLETVNFKFISGKINPADLTTRKTSYKSYLKSSYISGKSVAEILKHDENSQLAFSLPESPNNINPTSRSHPILQEVHLTAIESQGWPLVGKFSSFKKLISVQAKVLHFINNLKVNLKRSTPNKFDHIPSKALGHNFFFEAKNTIFKQEQRIYFPECVEYLENPKPIKKEIPNLVTQMNLYFDECGVIRVKCKTVRGTDPKICYAPIFIPRKSFLTEAIIMHLHNTHAHIGKYHVLRELRKEYWVNKAFSAVKTVLKGCVKCKRSNARPIKLNQSPYRDFRINPPAIPFRYIFIDYFGHYFVKFNDEKIKVWVLIITCLWSRAINLKICIDLSVNTFLKAIQTHIFDYGVPELVISDLGSQFQPASDLVINFLNDLETRDFLQSRNIQFPRFERYFKGNSALGSLVESLVKASKKLIYNSISKRVLDLLDFDFLIQQTKSIVNRRPITFKEVLRNNDPNEELPTPITPDMLIRGAETIEINIVPQLQPELTSGWEDSEKLVSSFQKLAECRKNMIEYYNSEFVVNLIQQSVDKKHRYAPIPHYKLKVGDIVITQEPNMKSAHWPLGIVIKVFENINSEITHVLIRKGNRSIIRRHVNTIIYLLSSDLSETEGEKGSYTQTGEEECASPPNPILKRASAKKGRENIKRLIEDGLA